MTIEIGQKPLNVSLRVQRNEDFMPAAFQWKARNLDGTITPIDLSSITLAMQVRRNGGNPGLLVNLPQVGSPLVTGLHKFDPVNGWFSIRILRGVWAAVLAGLEQETWRGAYDLEFQHVDGLREVVMRGSFSVEPGVTS